MLSRVPSVGEHILIDDISYVVKTIQYLKNSFGIAANVWVLQAPRPTMP
jgi:hypothetical protein